MSNIKVFICLLRKERKRIFELIFRQLLSWVILYLIMAKTFLLISVSPAIKYSHLFIHPFTKYFWALKVLDALYVIVISVALLTK